MSLYPSLEDMKVDQMARAECVVMAQSYAASIPPVVNGNPSAPVYPALGEYMGLELSESVIAANMPEYSQIALQQQVSVNKFVY